MGVSDDARRIQLMRSINAEILLRFRHIWRDSCSFIVRVKEMNVESGVAPALLRLRGSTGRWRQTVEAGYADVTL